MQKFNFSKTVWLLLKMPRSLKCIQGTAELPQWVKVFAANSDGLSWIPRIHVVNKRAHSSKLSSDLTQGCDMHKHN